MSKASCIAIVLLALSACDQEQSSEPGVPEQTNEPAAPAAPTPTTPTAAAAPTPATPTPEPAAEPAPAAELAAAEPEKPAGSSRTMTGEPTAKKPAGSVKPPEPARAPETTPTPAPAPAAAAGPCGEDGQPMCPLQAFMERNVQQPMEAGDLAAVGKGLARAAKLAPDPSWNAGPTGWSALAQTGIDAAAAGDEAALKQSCKSCHKAFRAKYKAEFRTKPL